MVSTRELEMIESQHKFGTFNKRTVIRRQPDDGSTVWQIFSTVQEAKDYFMSPTLQTIHEECCANLQYALISDDNGDATILKVTFDFTTKGDSNIAPDDDYAGQYDIRKSADNQPDPNKAVLEIIYDTNSSEHLF